MVGPAHVGAQVGAQVWTPAQCVGGPQVSSGAHVWWPRHVGTQVRCGAQVAPQVWMPPHVCRPRQVGAQVGAHVWMPPQTVGPPHVIGGEHV